MSDYPVTVTAVFDGEPQDFVCESATVYLKRGYVFVNEPQSIDRTTMVGGMSVDGGEMMLLKLEHFAAIEGPRENIDRVDRK